MGFHACVLLLMFVMISTHWITGCFVDRQLMRSLQHSQQERDQRRALKQAVWLEAKAHLCRFSGGVSGVGDLPSVQGMRVMQDWVLSTDSKTHMDAVCFEDPVKWCGLVISKPCVLIEVLYIDETL
jgi:hypothetical protein